MFCAERLQRVLMAIVLCLAFYLISVQNSFGMLILGFVIVMVFVWAITDFCPSIWIFKKLIGSCCDKKESKSC